MQFHKKIIILRAHLMPTRPANLALAFLLIACAFVSISPQTGRYSDDEFGPVVRAYLGYLKNEQEVVDDRVSRREISGNYYRRNSNRIKALRQMAIRLARETHNDYLPELEAVAADEFGLLFERPLPAASLKPGEVIKNTFRFLGAVRSGEIFYVFARLDPYEQAELTGKNGGGTEKEPITTEAVPKMATRTRRVAP
jgi:hypothetical protein